MYVLGVTPVLRFVHIATDTLMLCRLLIRHLCCTIFSESEISDNYLP